MTADREQDLLGQAIRWHVRIADGAEADWEAFTAWLEADPDHARVYDQLEAGDALLGDRTVPPVTPAPPVTPVQAGNDNPPARPPRWWIQRVAIAAVLVIAGFLGLSVLQRGNAYQVATAPGQTHVVMLESGDRIELNGSTTLTLDHNLPRFAIVEHGEATFTVQHRPDAPFIVLAGDERIEDIGTVFNVVRSDAGVRVAVAEGSVIYNPGAEAVKLVAGEALNDPGGAQDIAVSQVEPAMVGSWRVGRLSYRDAPLSRVAADLARATGERVSLDPAIGDRAFTGTIAIDADRSRLFADLSALTNLRASRSENGWILTDPNRETR